MSEQDEQPGDLSDQSQSPHVYSANELRRNRRNILLWTAGFIVFFWLASPQAAILLTGITVVVSLICLKLFASQSSSKLGDDFAGSGKRVHPRAMGTLLGYLYRGFRND